MKTIMKRLENYIPINQIFDWFANDAMAVFLDSSLDNKLGQYSIIGLHPYLVVEEKENTLYVNGDKREETFLQYIKTYIEEHTEENRTTLPLVSGAIGYLSYEYGRKFEGISSRHKPHLHMPEAMFCFYEHYIIEDHSSKCIYITAKGELESSECSLLTLERLVKGKIETKYLKNHTKYEGVATKEDTTEQNNLIGDYSARYNKVEYMSAVDSMIQYIIEGDIYIGNLTQQLKVNSTKNSYEVFLYLREHNPSPFGGYFNYDTFQIISASPERFLKVKNGIVETRPIKGTRKRGKTEEEDRILREDLLTSTKEKSELLMIVDLERNDLNRVCEPGSVKVIDNFSLEVYATVYHLVSTIQGKLCQGVTVMDLIEATFPGGSITGAPKIRAMEIIDELEGDTRGLYTGTMGYLSLNGDCDFNIVIRTAIVQNECYHIGVGGGITYESDLESEYEEILQKAKAVLEAIGQGTSEGGRNGKD